MDLELLEALALDEDRAAALARLIPGTDDHDYFRCVALQHAGDLDGADAVIRAWPQRHGRGDRYQRLRRRQLLYRLGVDPAAWARQVRDEAEVWLGHEPEAAQAAARYPTRLDPATIDRAALIDRAIEHSSDLDQVSDHGLPDLLDRDLHPFTRRALLARLGPTIHPRLVEHVADDLATDGSRGFGSLAIHQQLTLDQLHALADRRPQLRIEPRWIDAVIVRLRPAESDWRTRPAVAGAYLERLWDHVAGLAAAFNSLKSHVMWHRLDHDRRRGTYDHGRFTTYLALPRAASYVRRDWTERFQRGDLARVGGPFPATDLPPVTGEEDLVRDYLHHFLETEDGEAFAEWLDARWLEAERATARLLAGDPDAARWAGDLGPVRLAALRDRVDLDLALQNPERWRADDPVTLEVDVKHVPRLTVKVFRINVPAWFHSNGRDVDPTIDLDGLAARHELSFAYDEPPLRRVRRRVELDACARPGVYVVELIGNGKSSRAVIRKGDLRPVVRVGVAGPVVTVCDEEGQLLLDATLWLGGREYRPRPDGAITIPFSTRPGRVTALLCRGDLAVCAEIDHPAETYEFGICAHLERESLVAGQTARALVRGMLTVAGRPAPLSLVEDARVEISMTDVAGTATTREEPLALADDREAVVEWPVPEHAAMVTLTVRGKVRIVSEQRDLEVSGTTRAALATVRQTERTETAYLASTTGGHVLYLLGLTGEPRPHRPVAVSLRHRAVRLEAEVALETDEHGRIELGPLDDIAEVRVTSPAPARWRLGPPRSPAPEVVHVADGTDAVVPLPPGVDRPILIELRGDAPMRDAGAALTVDGGAAVASGLAPGAYRLVGPGLDVAIRVASPDANEVAGWLDDGHDAVEQSPVPTRIRAARLDGDELVVELADAGRATRVHVIATRFRPNRATRGLAAPPPGLRRVRRPPPASVYLSGRDLGDEYRYVLDRRTAPRRPGTSLERPGLLLNPWALRATSTDVQAASFSRGYAPPPARPAAAPSGAAGYAAAQIEAPDAHAAYDFLPAPAVVLANLRPAGGRVRVPRAELGDVTSVRVVCVAPGLTTFADVALEERPLAPRDLRLRLALEPDGHYVQDQQVTPLPAGGTFVAEDLATARVQVVDTVARAHAYLLTLSGDAALRELAFVTRWHTLDDGERRTQYAKYACHELHLFLYFKDPAFFAEVVRPYLAHKRHKTFVDVWLLDGDLGPWLEPWAFGRLNAVERALLACRLPDRRGAIHRALGDAVDLVPPDPEGDARRVDTLIAGGALDSSDDLGLEGARRAAIDKAEAEAVLEEETITRSAPRKKKMAARMRGPAAAADEEEAEERSDSGVFGAPPQAIDLDLADRRAAAPLYRAADKTQEWAESDWWHRRVDEMTADLVGPNRFWRDLAAWSGEGPFLSPHLGDCGGSLAEAMSALAVLGLPLAAAAHQVETDDHRLRITVGSPALIAWSRIVPIEPPAGPAAILVGQRYFRSDDRWTWDGAEQREKPVTGELLAGVVYVCRVVVSNPTGARERLAVLIQIPRGAIAVGGALPTRTVHADLDPYATWSYEYAFYFPSPGRWSCFPVHVTRRGELVACAPPDALEVVAAPTEADDGSWAHVSQHGSLDEVLALLGQVNLGRVDLGQIAWRMRDRPSFEAICAALEARHAYDHVLWGYALVHQDRARLAEWLRHDDAFVRPAGPLTGAAVELDPVARGWYQHLEYAPLVNARAHRLGARTRILNAALDEHYRAFLDVVAHAPRPSSDDLLAAAHYLFTMDRVDDALAAFDRVRPDEIASRLQYDYLAAYAAVCRGTIDEARAAASRWLDHPVDRWRRRFVALVQLLDEAAAPGAGRPALDPDSRDQRMAELAAREPTLDVTVDGADLVIDHQGLERCQVRLYPMDIELLFSRQPFVGADTGRFAFIEPAWTQDLALVRDGATRLPVPEAMRHANVVIEVAAGGLRRTATRFAHDLAVEVAHAYGQVRVVRASTRAPLPAAYVKCYARARGGAVTFYKDGYTDLAGRFDYATLSTDDLDRVERFALLVVADDAGATITEAAPPPR